MTAHNKFLHPADSDALAFADTPVNLLFRPEGSLVEQNLSNGESHKSEKMKKIYLPGQFFNRSREGFQRRLSEGLIRKCPAGGKLHDQPDSK